MLCYVILLSIAPNDFCMFTLKCIISKHSEFPKVVIKLSRDDKMYVRINIMIRCYSYIPVSDNSNAWIE